MKAVDGSAVTAGDDVIRVYLTGTGSADGSESLGVTVAAASVYDGAGNAAPHVSVGGVSAVSTGSVSLNDLAPPILSSSSLAGDNSYIDLSFDAGIYGDAGGTTDANSSGFSASCTVSGTSGG